MNKRRLISILSPADLVTIAFLLSLNILALIFHKSIAEWIWIELVNFTVIGSIAVLAYRAHESDNKLMIGLHRWYLYPAVIFVYMEIDLMIRPIHPVDYDSLLIAIDQWMFGVNPTQWIMQFAHPVVTEILQTAYFSYYLLFIIVGVGVYRTRGPRDFDRVGFLIVYGFFLSYLGYFLLPAVGPRFTLHDFATLSEELPGLLLTEPMRQFVNAGGGVPADGVNPVEVVHRDVFPSGHTQLSLVCVYLGYQYKLQTRHVLAVIVTLLIIATVYLRYHYVIDLIAGGCFFALTITTGHHIERWWNRLRGVHHDDSGSLTAVEPDTEGARRERQIEVIANSSSRLDT